MLAAIAEEALGTLVFAQRLKQQLPKQLMPGARPTAWLMCLAALPILLTAPVRKINAGMSSTKCLGRQDLGKDLWDQNWIWCYYKGAPLAQHPITSSNLGELFFILERFCSA